MPIAQLIIIYKREVNRGLTAFVSQVNDAGTLFHTWWMRKNLVGRPFHRRCAGPSRPSEGE